MVGTAKILFAPLLRSPLLTGTIGGCHRRSHIVVPAMKPPAIRVPRQRGNCTSLRFIKKPAPLHPARRRSTPPGSRNVATGAGPRSGTNPWEGSPRPCFCLSITPVRGEGRTEKQERKKAGSFSRFHGFRCPSPVTTIRRSHRSECCPTVAAGQFLNRRREDRAHHQSRKRQRPAGREGGIKGEGR